MNAFSSFHPVTTAIYFLSVMMITMFSSNPILLCSALFFAVASIIKTQKGQIFKDLLYNCLLFMIIAITNPIFLHNGVTPLFFVNGNAVTLESVVCGVNIGLMVMSVIYLFKCVNIVLTNDKILYLLGNVSPKIALLMSGALRFIPLIKTQAEKIKQSQKAMGLYSSDSLTDKLKGALRVYSALITWALENAVDTGASMKARGYGLKGRSRYSLYTFKIVDIVMLLFIAVLDAVVIFALATDKLRFEFYPSISYSDFNVYTISAIIAFILLCAIPLIIECKEALRWKYYKSKI